MAHPRKKRRTQAPGTLPTTSTSSATKTASGSRIPKSMVIRMGASNVGPSVTQLVHDTRRVMGPHTASRLKERRANKLRDYTTMAGPLGVSHFLLFSRGKESGNVNLRLGITPRGPTLGFRVERYSLCRDIVKSQRHPKAGADRGAGIAHAAPPLLVMNNFTTPDATADSKVPKHLESLLTSTFQSLFPPIAPQTTPLSAIRRVLLLNREQDPEEEGAYIVNFRHYAISARTLHPGLSKGVKRLQRAEKHAIARQRKPQPGTGDAASEASKTGSGTPANGIPSKKKREKGALPNMSRLDDVADYLLEGGYTSASETELDTDAEVEVYEPSVRKVMNRRDRMRLATKRQQAKSGTPDLGGGGGEDGEGDGVNGDGEAKEETSKTRRAPPTQKRAIKLTELGPRMRLRLLKVEEGLCEGKVMWHEFVEKSAAEEKRLEQVWEQRRREKEERRRVQRENLDAKRKAKAGTRGKKGEGDDDGGEDDEEVPSDVDDDTWDDEEMEEEEEIEEDEELEEE